MSKLAQLFFPFYKPVPQTKSNMLILCPNCGVAMRRSKPKPTKIKAGVAYHYECPKLCSLRDDRPITVSIIYQHTKH